LVFYKTRIKSKFTFKKKDGLPFAQEVKYQRSTCAFMQDAGVKLKMPQLSIATAIVFFS